MMKEVELPIFNIERFAIHDGAGIRTVVFLQGCRLRCVWCANPESHTVKKKLMYLQNKCTGCGRCVDVCPQKANSLNLDTHKAVIDRNLCTGCGRCVDSCIAEARSISGKMMSADKLYEVLIRDREYYKMTEGGITFSGGEALLYASQLNPLIKRLKEAGISIAFETCGYVPKENIQLLLPEVDQWLFDIKTLDPIALKKYTGGELSIILNNLKLIAEEHADEVTIRVPVIPSVNDSMRDMAMICDLLEALNIKRIDLLPYHTLGLTKYRQLDLEYPFSIVKPLHTEDLKQFSDYIRERGFQVQIGG